ncbi:CoA transferase [uncultured Sphingomonas sp.]|uniref:CaiB/BaiF CoA-transferase family protein n=1 Tax=uncultured Sphingomonas sp. TaxID=158754 RepID=UPI0035CA700F
MDDPVAIDRPLAGLRIVDAVAGPMASLTRYLAELGAKVDRIVAPSDDAIVDVAANAGKRMVVAADRKAALDAAHAIVADRDHGIDLAGLRSTRPDLVTMTVSDFGSDTSFADWQATDPILHALSGELSRSGLRGRAPLLPPGRLAYQCAAVQGAFALTTALYHAFRTGEGDHVDFSALDGAVQALDPGFGISGSATLGKPAHLLSRDRPARGFQYPILACADGHVRICLLARRQWQGMFRWMGEPAAFASPEFEKTVVRYKSPDLLPAIAAFFAPRTRSELEEEGQRHGVPIAAVLTFKEALAADHLRQREAFTRVDLADGSDATVPNGVVTIDGERMGPATSSPDARSWPTPLPGGALPFAGLRVLDLGVIVVGAEQGRLLADGGADVVKVESRAYPDGNRQSYLTYGLSVSFAAGHRNKRSLGINLRDPAGRALFLDLVRTADVVLSNFKPGTMESLGLGGDVIAATNPAIVQSDSSAFGTTGPWSGRMGYGPLVRAATGLTLAWRYPDDPQGFCDTVTIYPDHVAGRVGAIATVALLIRRLRTGRGGRASIAQAEVMLAQFAEEVSRAARGGAEEGPPDWPWGVYRAAGDDEWCVVTVREDADWQRLAAVIGVDDPTLATREGRRGHRSEIDAHLSSWMAERDADAVMTQLQAARVPAARMLRVADLPDFAYYRERDLFRVEHHPFLQERVIAERWSAKRAGEPQAPQAPAPLMGEQSEAIIVDWLGGEVDPGPLAAAGVIEPTDVATWAEARAGASQPRPARVAHA